ncbi:MAG TPA: hypothetical protein VLW46_00040, partial [Candidatus Bathyarchaeia archaeon]|nr:hypothetical protein [Candidatus Bathyarchaeia archaeon]
MRTFDQRSLSSSHTMHQRGVTHLIARPAFLAETPDSGDARKMDVLSEVLKVVKLEGALFFNGEFS